MHRIPQYEFCTSLPPPPAADVIQQWTDLKSAAMELQQRADGFSRLQGRVRAFRHGLGLLDERTARAARDVATVEDLEQRIAELKVRERGDIVVTSA